MRRAEYSHKVDSKNLVQLGSMMHLEVIDLEGYPVDERAVEMIPKQIAVKYSVLAVHQEGSQLTVVTHDPMNLYALEDIRLVTNMRIHLMLCEKPKIETAIELYYSELDARSAVSHADVYDSLTQVYMQEMAFDTEDSQAPIVRLLNSLLMKAYNTNVSDIHIEPYEKEMVIRMRRDGILKSYTTLPLSSHHGLVARTKILAHMDIAEKRKPQDGHFKIKIQNVEMNIRVSFVPTVYGEKGVLRFLNTNTAVDRTESFGMSEENYEKMIRILKRPHGIIYVTGPTGSGKTTALYAILEYLSQKPVNIMTIEDPVERTISKLNQIQVNERANVTFGTGLRAILRQDPDIIVVGETRDLETASTSVRAAITGHLVFSTLHTNSAASAIIRLKDMGVPEYMLSASVSGVMAQRLVRKICPHCAEEYEADEREKRMLYGDGAAVKSSVILKRGAGCYHCDGEGYRGRIAIHEILEIDSGLRKMISEGRMIEELEAYAVSELKMSTLQDEMRTLVEGGITEIGEMEHILYSLD